MTFEVLGPPATMGSYIPFTSKSTGRACLKPYKEKGLRAWQQAVKLVALIEARRVGWGPPRKCAMAIEVTCYLPRPASHYLRASLRPNAPAYPISANGPDEDKNLRATQDATEGVVVDKDGRYVHGCCIQYYADGRLPGAIVRVSTVGE